MWLYSLRCSRMHSLSRLRVLSSLLGPVPGARPPGVSRPVWVAACTTRGAFASSPVCRSRFWAAAKERPGSKQHQGTRESPWMNGPRTGRWDGQARGGLDPHGDQPAAGRYRGKRLCMPGGGRRRFDVERDVHAMHIESALTIARFCFLRCASRAGSVRPEMLNRVDTRTGWAWWSDCWTRKVQFARYGKLAHE